MSALPDLGAAHVVTAERDIPATADRLPVDQAGPVTIGERRKPDPHGRPGYLRVDTVHQGDRDGIKGVYHVNAVDEVTQWQVVGTTAQISEAWLLPVLEAMMKQFPFHIRGFHSDNGSEFINHTVARLLNKLLVEQTKSRPRHSNDNGLVESKNGAVVRKHMGYGHIEAAHAEAIKEFYRVFQSVSEFSPAVRSARSGETQGQGEGVYRWYATPWEILRQLPDWRALEGGADGRGAEPERGEKSDTAAARQCKKRSGGCLPASSEDTAHE